jgi:CheY-like chemotaxis protein
MKRAPGALTLSDDDRPVRGTVRARSLPGMSARPVLVVDDDPLIRETVRELLADEGFVVRTAGDGAEALRLTALDPPGLILLDMNMPGIDGWEFARRYRATAPPHARIVVITATFDAGRGATEIAADGVVTKPFDLEHLLTLVERLLDPGD